MSTRRDFITLVGGATGGRLRRERSRRRCRGCEQIKLTGSHSPDYAARAWRLPNFGLLDTGRLL